MLRKVIWFALVFFVGYIWFTTMLKCSNERNAEVLSQVSADTPTKDSDEVFKADEDSGDDGYIISDDSENEEEDSLEDEGKFPEDEDIATVDNDEEMASSEDFAEKSPVSRKETRSISREAIRETTYTDDSSIGYYVITGSFSDEVNADQMVESLKDMGYNEAEKVVFDFSQYYSVVSGKYDSESSARAKSLELKNKNINAYVHKMRSKLFGE